MSTINQLSAISALSGGDLFAVWQTSNGDSRKVSVNTLIEYFEDNFSSPDFDKTVNVPVTGFNLSFTDNSQNQWLILRPAGTLATGTVVLPVSTGIIDGQEVKVTSTEAVTALTVNGNGATVNGGPTTLAADGYFTLKYEATTAEWYRVS